MSIRIDGTNTAANPGITGADADTGLQFGTNEVSIVTGGTEKVKVDSSGNLGIGTTAPSNELHVVGVGTVAYFEGSGGSGFIGIEDTDDNTAAFIGVDGDSLKFQTSGNNFSDKLVIDSSGKLGIAAAANSDAMNITSGQSSGTSYEYLRGMYGSTLMYDGTLSFRVFTNGNVQNTNNSYGAISDIKLKENIVDASSQWDDLKAIQIRNYNFIEGQTHTQIGVVAQEVETVSPGLVTETPDRDAEGEDLDTTTKSVNYSVLYMKAVKALQEAMERIETLETQNASLEARLTALEGGAE